MSSRGSSGIPSVAEEDEDDLSSNGGDDEAAAATVTQSRLRESFDHVYEELESGGDGGRRLKQTNNPEMAAVRNFIICGTSFNCSPSNFIILRSFYLYFTFC